MYALQVEQGKQLGQWVGSGKGCCAEVVGGRASSKQPITCKNNKMAGFEQ